MARKERRWLGTTDPFVRLKQIEALDLETDYREITKLFYADFQSTMVAKSINGFMMNYAAPRISRVLRSSGELEHRISKRVIDTIILASAVMMEGFTGKGRDAARRVNAMHRQYDIHPDDFIAVGAEEAVGSIVLAELYGWRTVTDKEREAVNRYYSHQARAFGSPNPLPVTYAETKAYFEDYLDNHVYYEPQNERLGKVLLSWIGTMAPKGMRSLYRFILIAQLDDRVARACGMRPASRLAKWLSYAALKHIGGKLPVSDGGPSHLDALVRHVYPNGYEISQVGTHAAPLTNEMNAPTEDHEADGYRREKASAA